MHKYINKELTFQDIPLSKLTKKHKTPFYVYSLKTLKKNYNKFYDAAVKANLNSPLVCFALKSNPNPDVIKALFKIGAGADIVSGGELTRSLEAGCDPQKIVFSGVGKTQDEIIQAIKCHKSGIYSFNVESIEELELINICAKKLKKVARVSFRLNPKVNAKTHRHISTGNKTHKFGILKADILKTVKVIKKYKHINHIGLSVHIGSQLTCLRATNKAIKELCELANEIPYSLEMLDMGGGLGVDYKRDNTVSSPEVYMQGIEKILAKNLNDKTPRIFFEPGRYISASAGIFVAKVLRTKKSEDCFFAILDGGMNDFVRTSLYSAYHEILPLAKNQKKKVSTDIVGPICETACSFASDYKIQKLATDDYVAVMDTGAYGHSMSSTYNLRERAKELILR